MWLKPFSTSDHSYLYATESNRIFQIDTELADYFQSAVPDEEKYATASRLGIVGSSQPHIGIFEADLISRGLEKIDREGPAHLALSVTESCNFRCRYCSFSGAYRYSREHTNRSMPLETALQAIRWYFTFGRDAYHIGFYGGEPLLKHKLICKVIAAARANVPQGAMLDFGMTTNGWLLKDSITDFLAEEQVELFVSLDGSEEQHDRYRHTRKQQPTFRRVWNNVQRLRERHPAYYRQYVNFSITLAPPNQPEAVREFIRQHPETFKGKLPKLGSLNNASSTLTSRLGIPSSVMDTQSIREDYLQQLVRGEEPDAFSQAMYASTFRKLHQREMGVPEVFATSAGQCVPGMRCHVTTDGKLHMCEHGDEHWSIGDVYNGFDDKRIAEILHAFHQQVQSRCENCWAVRLCRKCIPQMAEGPEFSPVRLAALCRSRQRELEQNLIDYCAAREQSPHCFDRLTASESVIPISSNKGERS